MMKKMKFILLITLIQINFGNTTYSPRSPEPISEDIDIHNLMFAPPHQPIDQILYPSSPPKDQTATRSVIVESGNVHSIPVHESGNNEDSIKRKPLVRIERAQYMREYRKRLKMTNKEEEQRRNKRRVERRKEVCPKRKDFKLTQTQIEKRRKLQRQNYQKLKQQRGYGKKNEFDRKDLNDKLRQGIATSEEIEKFHHIKMKDRQYYHNKTKKNGEKGNLTLPKP